MAFKDPTYDEMRTFLKRFMTDEHTDFDMEEAIYWYAHDYHGGQSSNLYSTLSSLSPFKPGAYSTGLSDGEALDLYMELQLEYGGA